jgi:isoquinoline 1-oxidoreductase beta subunit
MSPVAAQRSPAGPGQAGGQVIAQSAFEPNAFIRIGQDDIVTVYSKHLEMGQGVYTGLATIVADELDADWAQMRVESSEADARRYNNLFFGPVQGSGGSTSIANSWEQLRKAAATTRAMLLTAAAQTWDVPEADIAVAGGQVTHKASNRMLRFGELAGVAAQLPVPADVPLKDATRFTLIGKHAPRKDSLSKANGSAVFTQDIYLPGMLVAMVAHPPLFGAKVKRFDPAPARAVQGVVDVVQIPTGVAVLAKDTWSARKGREALRVQWDDSNAFKMSSGEITAQYRTLAGKPGLVARRDGDPDTAIASASSSLEAEFAFPFLAHAAMEPMNCVVQVGSEGCEMWFGSQLQTVDQARVAQVLGLKPEQVRINTLYAGGSFGRRANPYSDYVIEAATIARAAGGRAPVKLVWTREDDMQAGFYRPAYLHRLRAGLDASGRLVGWQHRIVGQSILVGTMFEPFLVKDGIDATSVEGAANLPYAIPNLQVDLHTTKLGVPVQWWRSVGSTHTAYATETFIDELAAAAGKDPFEFRRAMLEKHPRHHGVLTLAASKANWGTPLPPGRGRGIAVHESFNTFVAQVAEVTVGSDGSFTVDRVVCAVDCGVAVNPDVVRAQMEGGIGYGLSAALHGTITLEGGRVKQSNFHDYPVLRINEMPKIEVHIVASNANPTGVGEPGTPVVAPALANALYAATGRRLRTLPLSLSSSGRA